MTALACSAAISTALVAGIFFAFSSFIMRALARLEPRAGIAAMQSINVVVLNPWFFGVFFGAGALCVATVLVSLSSTGPVRAAVWIGTVSYLMGCIGVTAALNVPLNERLVRVEPGEERATELWEHYLARWTLWNHLRTAASLAAAAAFASAAALT